MTRKIGFLGLVSVLFVAPAYGQAIAIHPANPHYYLFHGQPTILITSAEHYGAVVNLDFDYVAYLDALKAYGLNYTRDLAGRGARDGGGVLQGQHHGSEAGPDHRALGATATSQGYVYGGNKYRPRQVESGVFRAPEGFHRQGGRARHCGGDLFLQLRSTPIVGLSLPCITKTTSRAWASAISRTPRR